MKILFLQKRVLFPVDCGWRTRTLNVLRPLAKWHDVTYACNVQPGDEDAVEQMKALGLRMETVPWRETARYTSRFYFDLARNAFSRHPFTVAKDHNRALRLKAGRLLEGGRFDLVICDFIQMARNVVGLPVPATVLFQHNVESQVFERQAHTGGSRARRAYMTLQHRKMLRFEKAAGGAFDRVIAVSPEDRARFETLYGWSHVRTIDTAVDVEFFAPVPATDAPRRLVFVGSLDWLPNEDGLAYFASAIWPRIRDAHPDAECHVVGRHPSPAVWRLSRAAGFTVFPNVPDVRPHLAEAAVAIVPTRIGGGTRLKVFEAMAMQKPVVSTEIGVEGLPVTSGKHLLVADDAAQFAVAVNQCLDDGVLRKRLAASARAFVLQRFTPQIVARQFESICYEAVEQRVRQGDVVSNAPSRQESAPSAG